MHTRGKQNGERRRRRRLSLTGGFPNAIAGPMPNTSPRDQVYDLPLLLSRNRP